MITWLTVITGAVVAIATVALAFITWWYVRLTRQLVEASYKPEVIVYLRTSPTLIRDTLEVNEMTLCVKNVGPGVARKIDFGDNLSFAPYGGEPLENIGFLKNGIDVLAPGQERRQNQPSVADPFGDLSQLQVTIPVNYEDSRGTKYSDAFLLILPSQIYHQLKVTPNEQTLLRR